MADGGERRRWRIGSPWIALVAVIAAVLRSAAVLPVYFLGDDFEGIRAVRDEGPTFRWLTEAGVGGHIRPLSRLSLWATHSIGGTDPVPYRLWGVVLHGLTAWLVGLLALELLRARAVEDRVRWAPWIAMAAFVLLPSHSEPVTWIAAQADLVLAPCVVVLVLAWSRWRRMGGRWRWVACAAFGLALLAKEPAVILPLVLVAHDLWLPSAGSGWWERVRRSGAALAPIWAILVGYVVLYVVGSGVFAGQEGTGIAAGPLVLVRSGVQVVVRSVLPPLPLPASVALLGAGLLAALAVAGVAWSRRAELRSSPMAGLVGFLATALVITVVPIANLGVSMETVAGERLAYVPSIFSTVLVGIGLGLLVDRAPRLGLVAVATVAVVSVLAVHAADGAYRRGGAVSERMARSIGELPRDVPITILTMPDTLDGAWIGRDRTPSDVSLVNGWRHPERFREVSEFTMGGPYDTVSVSSGSCATCVRLHLDDEAARFAYPMPSEIPVAHPEAGVTAISVDERTIELQLDPDVDPSRFWYFSGGRYLPLGS